MRILLPSNMRFGLMSGLCSFRTFQFWMSPVYHPAMIETDSPLNFTVWIKYWVSGDGFEVPVTAPGVSGGACGGAEVADADGVGGGADFSALSPVDAQPANITITTSPMIVIKTFFLGAVFICSS